MDHEAVERDADEPRVGDFAPGGIEARRGELDVQLLPETRRPARVAARCVALVALLTGRARGVPTLIDPAAIPRGRRRLAPTVDELDLVATLQIDAGVGAGREEKFEIEFDVAVLPSGEEIFLRRIRGHVDQHARSREGDKGLLASRIAADATGELPVGAGSAKGRERVQRDRIRREERLGVSRRKEAEREDEGGTNEAGRGRHVGRNLAVPGPDGNGFSMAVGSSAFRQRK